jgi:hypothetical protein
MLDEFYFNEVRSVPHSVFGGFNDFEVASLAVGVLRSNFVIKLKGGLFGKPCP